MELKTVEGTKMIRIMNQPGVGIGCIDGYTSMGLLSILRIWSSKGVTSPEHLFLYLSICPGMSLRLREQIVWRLSNQAFSCGSPCGALFNQFSRSERQ